MSSGYLPSWGMTLANKFSFIFSLSVFNSGLLLLIILLITIEFIESSVSTDFIIKILSTPSYELIRFKERKEKIEREKIEREEKEEREEQERLEKERKEKKERERKEKEMRFTV